MCVKIYRTYAREVFFLYIFIYNMSHKSIGSNRLAVTNLRLLTSSCPITRRSLLQQYVYENDIIVHYNIILCASHIIIHSSYILLLLSLLHLAEEET